MLKIFTLSSRAGTASDGFLGPYFLLPCLTGAVYNDFLRNVLPEQLQDLDMQSRINLLFMYDSTLVEFLLAIRELLTNVFPNHG